MMQDTSNTWTETGRARGLRGRLMLGAGLSGLLALTAACSEPEVILTGTREDPRSVLQNPAPGDLPVETANESRPISLPAVQGNANWPQRHTTPATRVSNAALSPAPQLAWSAPIGEGDSRKFRITADPVVADGRVFTLDAVATVTAVSTGGQVLWSHDLVPPRDSDGDASGGGLATGGGRLYVSSAFGMLTALDPATGNELWTQRLNATGSGTPTYHNGVVYVTSGDNLAWAVEADTGRIRWQLSAAPDINNIVGGPAPAVTDQIAVFGFGSGEVQGAYKGGGMRVWDTIVNGRREGYARANVDDITGDPVIVGDTVYVGSSSGRMVALNLASGARVWSTEEGPISPAWVAGGSVFLLSDRNELVRLDASDGSRIWAQPLRFFVKDKPKKQKEVFAYYGPILAGGRLVVSSNEGYVYFFDPASGTLTGQVEVPGGATSAPVVAGNTLYVVGSDGTLYAYR